MLISSAPFHFILGLLSLYRKWMGLNTTLMPTKSDFGKRLGLLYLFKFCSFQWIFFNQHSRFILNEHTFKTIYWWKMFDSITKFQQIDAISCRKSLSSLDLFHFFFYMRARAKQRENREKKDMWSGRDKKW